MKTGKECVCEEDCGCGACGKMLVGGFRLSTASAKPAPKKLRLDFTPSEMGMLMGITLRIPEPELKAQWEAFLKRVVYIEAHPDAERTALEELRKKVEHGPWITLYDCQDCGQLLTSALYQIHNADHTVITLNYIDRMAMLAEIDAQERAGAKAASEQGGAT